MLHPITFSLRRFCGIAFSLGIFVGQLSGVVFQHFLFEAILRNCIIKIFTIRQLSGVVSPHFVLEQPYGVVFSQNISFEAILWNWILKIFRLRQLCGIVFSKHFLWGNSAELYSQNIFFRAALRSCIPTLPFEAIMHNCILKTFHLGQLSRVVFSHFPFRQLCGVVF